MAIDTAAKRFSVNNFLLPSYAIGILPDGTIGVGDRQAVSWMYSGISATADVYTSYNSGMFFKHDTSVYNTITVYFEALLKTSNASKEAKARLYDITLSSVVTNSGITTAATTYDRKRSSAITLVNGNEYRAEIGGQPGGGTYSCLGARILIDNE